MTDKRTDDDRHVTFGLSEHARHEPDEASGHQLMPSAWSLTAVEEKIASLPAFSTLLSIWPWCCVMEGDAGRHRTSRTSDRTFLTRPGE